MKALKSGVWLVGECLLGMCEVQSMIPDTGEKNTSS